MGLTKTLWSSPKDYLRVNAPEHPVVFFSPAVLQETAMRFIAGFDGLVTYAVKSNPDEQVLANLIAAGVNGFDVASIAEMDLIRALAPQAALHFNNPVRSRAEIAHAAAIGVNSYTVDSHSELRKIFEGVDPEGVEISVRFKLPVKSAAYDFGVKFGADEAQATSLLKEAKALGFTPSLAFHPGTQCNEPSAWVTYIETAAEIVRAADVSIARLNVGGGFPSHRLRDEQPRLHDIFAAIPAAVKTAFGADAPAILCEPGRALVAESYSVATRVKAIRDGADVFLNDGTYGVLSELHLVGVIDRVDAFGPGGELRVESRTERRVFGPTCDSTDRLPSTIGFPKDMQERPPRVSMDTAISQWKRSTFRIAVSQRATW